MIIQKSISLHEDLWGKIDKKRGDISRSRFIAKILVDSIDFPSNRSYHQKKISKKFGQNKKDCSGGMQCRK